MSSRLVSDGQRFIDIKFSESRFHPNLTLPDQFHFTLGTMNSAGALLASQCKDQEEHENFIEEDSSNMRARIKFFSFVLDTEWERSFSWGESPTCLAVGTGFCVVCSNKNFLRVFNTGGLELIVVSCPLPVVALAAYGSELAIALHRGAPLLGFQNLAVETWALDGLSLLTAPEEFVKEESALGLGAWEHLEWFGYSQGGVLFALDSSRMLRGYWRRLGHWVPLCQLQQVTTVVGIIGEEVAGCTEDSELLCFEYFHLPLLQAPPLQEQLARKTLRFDMGRDEALLSAELLQLDKDKLKGFTSSLAEGDEAAAYGFAQSFFLEKTRAVAVAFLKRTNNMRCLSKFQEVLNVTLSKESPAVRAPPPPPAAIASALLQPTKEMPPLSSFPPAAANPFASGIVSNKPLEEELSLKRKLTMSSVVKRMKTEDS